MRTLGSYLLLGLILILSSCSRGTPAGTQTDNAYPSLIPPWQNSEVFYDETVTINIELGDKFIIRYDYYHDLFPIFERSYDQSPTIISFLEERDESTYEFQDFDGIRWFLFQAVHTGDVTLTIKHFTHQSDVVQDQKTFKIHVGYSLC